MNCWSLPTTLGGVCAIHYFQVGEVDSFTECSQVKNSVSNVVASARRTSRAWARSTLVRAVATTGSSCRFMEQAGRGQKMMDAESAKMKWRLSGAIE